MSENGMIQYYRPSGAIWAHNATADDQYPDESRPWKIETVKDPEDPENLKMVLKAKEEKQLLKTTHELLKRANLLSEQAYFDGVKLDQVAKLNEKGTEVDHFPGEATARFLYKLDGVPVDGAGAKSYAFFNPGDSDPELKDLGSSLRLTFVNKCQRSNVDLTPNSLHIQKMVLQLTGTLPYRLRTVTSTSVPLTWNSTAPAIKEN